MKCIYVQHQAAKPAKPNLIVLGRTMPSRAGEMLDDGLLVVKRSTRHNRRFRRNHLSTGTNSPGKRTRSPARQPRHNTGSSDWRIFLPPTQTRHHPKPLLKRTHPCAPVSCAILLHPVKCCVGRPSGSVSSTVKDSLRAAGAVGDGLDIVSYGVGNFCRTTNARLQLACAAMLRDELTADVTVKEPSDVAKAACAASVRATSCFLALKTTQPYPVHQSVCSSSISGQIGARCAQRIGGGRN